MATIVWPIGPLQAGKFPRRDVDLPGTGLGLAQGRAPEWRKEIFSDFGGGVCRAVPRCFLAGLRVRMTKPRDAFQHPGLVA